MAGFAEGGADVAPVGVAGPALSKVQIGRAWCWLAASSTRKHGTYQSDDKTWLFSLTVKIIGHVTVGPGFG